MKVTNLIKKIVLIVTLGISVLSCESDTPAIEKFPTILEIAKADQTNFSVFLKSLDATGLTTTLSNAGSYTVFVPTNAAFATYTSTLFPTGINDATFPVSPATLSSAQIAELRRLLQNHVLGVGTKSSDLIAAGYSKTFATAVGTTTMSMFVNKNANGDVLVNGGLTNGGAIVTKADIDASNGIVHIVNGVVKLPTVVNLIAANPLLSSLTSVVTSTSGTYGDQSAVKNALNGNGPFTVFAPNNDAFNAATTGAGFLTGAIVTQANVTKILQYHTSNGNLTSNSTTSWTSSSATSDVTITTLAPASQKFTITRGTVKLTELPVISVPAANIKTVNIQAVNGSIHIIDRVLKPVLP